VRFWCERGLAVVVEVRTAMRSREVDIEVMILGEEL
jgi:hypothetical protein